VISSCGAGGRRDPAHIRMADLAEVKGDALARAVRQALRRTHGITAQGGALGIQAVYSTEPVCLPVPALPDAPARAPGSMKPGTLCHVTGVFGFFCAAAALEQLLA